MGRHRKYTEGCEVVTISLPKIVLQTIDTAARQLGKGRSEFINKILEHYAMDQKSFCVLMAKKAAADLYYWKNKAELTDLNLELEPIEEHT